MTLTWYRHFIPLSQLITADCTIQEGKWFNIGGNIAIVTRYRLDSQFHFSYLESRGVPGKNRGEIRIKSAGNYLPFISGSRLPVPVTSLPVTSGDATSGDIISGDVTIHHKIHHKCGLNRAYILLGFVSLYCEYPVLFFMSLFFFCSFSFGHCIVCPLIYGFWFHLWYL